MIKVKEFLTLLTNREGNVTIRNSEAKLYSGPIGDTPNINIDSQTNILDLSIKEFTIVDKYSIIIKVEEQLSKYEFLFQCPGLPDHIFEVEAYSKESAMRICINQKFSQAEKDAYENDEHARLYPLY